MSARIRPRDIINPIRIAISATITERGWLRADRTRRIVFYLGLTYSPLAGMAEHLREQYLVEEAHAIRSGAQWNRRSLPAPPDVEPEPDRQSAPVRPDSEPSLGQMPCVPISPRPAYWLQRRVQRSA